MPQPPKQPLDPQHAGAVRDPWNSASTGHQRPESNPGTGWRESRNRKLHSQFGAGDGSGGARLSDTWGEGAEDYDAARRKIVPKWIGERKGKSVMDMLKKPGLMKKAMEEKGEGVKKDGGLDGLVGEEAKMEKRRREDEDRAAKLKSTGLFEGVVFYINGSTYPLVSDHKLKQIISEHGGTTSLHLGRRRVTHVILGRPNGHGHGGIGGGLAAGKIEKEIQKTRGCGVKFVGVEWVLESLKAGKRLPEARFSNLKIATKSQGSVYGLYSEQSPTSVGASKPTPSRR